jgi:uncharacterized protein YeaO (DUF488 family)
MLKIKRIHDPVSSTDGKRILSDRLWPRSLKKQHNNAVVLKDVIAGQARLCGMDPRRATGGPYGG